MFRSALHITLSVLCLFALLAPLPAQDEKEKPPKKEAADKEDKEKEAPKKKTAAQADEDYRQFFKKPETPQEFWRAMQFEIEVGRFDLAARQLHGLLDQKPADPDLLEILDKEGLSGFLRLRNFEKWGDDPKDTAQARKDVEQLITLVTAAQKKLLTDPERIGRFIKNLNATPEEREYAVKQLYRSGANAVAYLVAALEGTSGEERGNILFALRHLGSDAVPAINAALDGGEPALQLDLIDAVHDRVEERQVYDPLKKQTVVERRSDLPLLRRRAETDPAPYWWPLTAAADPRVRQKAAQAVGDLLDVSPSRLPPAKLALTREAERYYQHQVKFLDPGAVTIWRWDATAKRLVAGWPGAATVTTSKAEEYYGLRFARQALAIDPSYEPAQVVFLSLALEKGVERAGLDQPLAKAAPEVHDVLARVNPDLVTNMLDRALTDQNLPVILGSVRALGDLAETRATRPTSHGESALLRALYYPDRRIHFAAAVTLLRVAYAPAGAASGRTVRPSAPASARVVEVLRRAVAAEPLAKGKPKVVLGLRQQALAVEASKALEKVGFEPVVVNSGRDVLRRLNEAADIDLVLVDADLPDPGLASLLGNLRSDVNTGLLPVVVLVPAEREDHLRRLTEHYRNVSLAPPALVLDVDAMKRILPVLVTEAMGRSLGEAQLKDYAERSVGWLARLARGEVPGYDVQPAGETVLSALHDGRLSPEGQRAAIEVAGRLPGAKAQSELAAVIVDAKRDATVRNAAAAELVRHIQQHGSVLAANDVKSLEALLASKETDGTLRANAALVMGSLRPSARLTGERLKDFQTLPPVKEKK